MCGVNAAGLSWMNLLKPAVWKTNRIVVQIQKIRFTEWNVVQLLKGEQIRETHWSLSGSVRFATPENPEGLFTRGGIWSLQETKVNEPFAAGVGERGGVRGWLTAAKAGAGGFSKSASEVKGKKRFVHSVTNYLGNQLLELAQGMGENKSKRGKPRKQQRPWTWPLHRVRTSEPNTPLPCFNFQLMHWSSIWSFHQGK